MRHARFVYGIALEDAAAMSPGGQCDTFKIAPRMFTPANSLVETQGELEILNTGDAVSEGDEVVAVSDISGFWTRFQGVGGGGSYVTFEFVDEASVSQSQSLASASASASQSSSQVAGDCESRVIATGPFYGRVINKACGMSSVPGERADGLIELSDEIGIMDGRDEQDIVGRIGFAVRMQREPESSLISGSVSIEPDCYWMIVIVNFWRTVRVVSDFIFDGKDITVRYKNITVWDDCQLPDEVIEGIDCEESSGSVSGSAASGSSPALPPPGP